MGERERKRDEIVNTREVKLRSRERLVSKFGAVDVACDPTDDLSAFIPVPARSRPRLLRLVLSSRCSFLRIPRRLVTFLSLFKTSRSSAAVRLMG